MPGYSVGMYWILWIHISWLFHFQHVSLIWCIKPFGFLFYSNITSLELLIIKVNVYFFSYLLDKNIVIVKWKLVNYSLRKHRIGLFKNLYLDKPSLLAALLKGEGTENILVDRIFYDYRDFTFIQQYLIWLSIVKHVEVWILV